MSLKQNLRQKNLKLKESQRNLKKKKTAPMRRKMRKKLSLLLRISK
jgi:hypothetical protein